MKNVKNLDELDTIHFDNKDKLVVLKFSADWCLPCKTMGNLIESIESDYDDVIFVECDINKADTDFLDKFSIHAIPAFFFFKDGLQIGQCVGSKDKKEFKGIIEDKKNK